MQDKNSETTRLEFGGSPLVETFFKELVYDSFGKTIVEEVNKRYKGTPADIHYKLKENAPIPCNPYALSAIDEVVSELIEDARIIFPEELRFLFFSKGLPEGQRHFHGLGVILDYSGHNHKQAIKLYKTIHQRNINPDKDIDLFPAFLLRLRLKKSRASGGLKLVFDDEYSILKTIRPKELSHSLMRDLPRELTDETQKKPAIKNLGLASLSFLYPPEEGLYWYNYELPAVFGSTAILVKGGSCLEQLRKYQDDKEDGVARI